MHAAHEAARAHMTQAMRRQKHQYDAGVRHMSYEEGQIVWLHNAAKKKGRSLKLSRPWKGPYLIVTKFNEVNFRIQASPRSKPLIVHADRLKPCYGRSAADLGFKEPSEPVAELPEPATQAGEPASVVEDARSEASYRSSLSTGSSPYHSPCSTPPVSPRRTRYGRPVRPPRRLQDFVT